MCRRSMLALLQLILLEAWCHELAVAQLLPSVAVPGGMHQAIMTGSL